VPEGRGRAKKKEDFNACSISTNLKAFLVHSKKKKNFRKRGRAGKPMRTAAWARAKEGTTLGGQLTPSGGRSFPWELKIGKSRDTGEFAPCPIEKKKNFHAGMNFPEQGGPLNRGGALRKKGGGVRVILGYWREAAVGACERITFFRKKRALGGKLGGDSILKLQRGVDTSFTGRTPKEEEIPQAGGRKITRWAYAKEALK